MEHQTVDRKSPPETGRNLTHIDLFSGIGGFALAAKWAGFETKVFCEIDPFCQKVLKKHWPDVPIVEDIKKFNGKEWTGATLITAGFPCQDISVANAKGCGIEGERSGLWRDICPILSNIRPRYALMENSSNLTVRGLGIVLGDLAEIGYDSEWNCIPASYYGANHGRDRIWVVAYPKRLGRKSWPIIREGIKKRSSHGQSYNGSKICDKPSNHWAIEPNIRRVAYGVPSRMDRLKALGNAIVPQVAYQIIKAIADMEGVCD